MFIPILSAIEGPTIKGKMLIIDVVASSRLSDSWDSMTIRKGTRK